MSKPVFKSIFGGADYPHQPTQADVPQPPPILTEKKEPQLVPETPQDLLKKQLEAARLGTAQFNLNLNTPGQS